MDMTSAMLLEQWKDTLPGMIDHTKLTFGEGEDPEAAIDTLCQEAQEYGFSAVCVRPYHVKFSCSLLGEGSPVKVATVIGFPAGKVERDAEFMEPTVGSPSLEEKLAEIRQVLADGAQELDVVLNVGQFQQGLQQGNTEATLNELKAIVQASQGKLVKLIIETDLLHSAEIESATQLCVDAGIGMVKTCTGMVQGGRGATPAIVRQIASVLEQRQAALGIKASGGIKTAVQAIHLAEAGATRLGASAGVSIAKSLLNPELLEVSTGAEAEATSTY